MTEMRDLAVYGPCHSHCNKLLAVGPKAIDPKIAIRLSQPFCLKKVTKASIRLLFRLFFPKDGVAGWLNGLLAGRYYSANGMCPLNVTSPEDAIRQGIVLRMNAEGELHRCVYDMTHAPMTLLPGATLG